MLRKKISSERPSSDPSVNSDEKFANLIFAHNLWNEILKNEYHSKKTKETSKNTRSTTHSPMKSNL